MLMTLVDTSSNHDFKIIESSPKITNTVGIINGVCPIAFLEHESFKEYEALSSKIPNFLENGSFRSELEKVPI